MAAEVIRRFTQPGTPTSTIGSEGGELDVATTAALAAERGKGVALERSVRAPMEEAFGTDFGAVRIHTDSSSDELNRRLQARAFTTGSDVFFSARQYAPTTRGGRELLAHELTHVVQQGGIARSFAGHGVIRRALELDASAKGSDRVLVNDQRCWESVISSNMKVNGSQDRCHVISFEQIRLGVWQALVEYMYDDPTHNFTTFQSAIVRWRSAVFPHGGTAGTHQNPQLKGLAGSLWKRIDAMLLQIQKSGANESAVVPAADAIVHCLNNSPDNLRPGDKTTNQSIGSGLDPRAGEVVKVKYPKVGYVWEIRGVTARQLMALDVSQRQNTIEAWVSSTGIQSSDVLKQTAAAMKSGNLPIYLNDGVKPPEALH